MKRFLSGLITILLLVTLFSGCTDETVLQLELEGRSESKTWENMPAFTFGQLETEKLAVVPWYDGRMESVSKNRWAETKDGYYYVTGGCLYYADKANLDLWVPVCNQPNCPHTSMIRWSYGEIKCNCDIGGNVIWIRDGRIWFEGSLNRYPHLQPEKSEVQGNAIFSIALNGTDPRLEYRHDGMELSFMGGGSAGYEQGSRYSIVILNTVGADGLENLSVLLMTAQGAKIVHEQKGENLPTGHWWSPFFGDDAVYVYAISPYLLRLVGEELIPLDVSDYEELGGYLSGNFLRQYRPGDGYYDVNLETGEEVKLCDPRLEHSTAQIMLPNCIVEHNLNSKDMDDNAPRSMEIFDGTLWRTVELPDDLRHRQFGGNFNLAAIASDRIFFSIGKYLYQVMLEKDNLTMELLGTMRTR